MGTFRDNSKPFKPAPAGLHRAVCVDVVDLGWQEDSFDTSKTKPKIRLMFEIDEEIEPGKRFIVSTQFNVPQSLASKKSSLVQTLTSWRGRPFTPEEVKAFDSEKLIGAPCQLNIIHSDPTSDGKVYANIDSIVPAHKDGKLFASGKYIRMKDREDWKAPKLSAFDVPPESEPTATEGETHAQSDDIPF